MNQYRVTIFRSETFVISAKDEAVDRAFELTTCDTSGELDDPLHAVSEHDHNTDSHEVTLEEEDFDEEVPA